MTQEALPPRGSLGAWMLAIRPKTLSAGAMPVVVGAAYAHAWIATHDSYQLFGSERAPWVRAAAAMVVALGIQIGTNLVNDVADHFKGADTHDRLGPARVTHLGLLSPRSVVTGAVVGFGAAAVAGVWLLLTLPGGWLPNWPTFVLGILALVCGVLYTVGPVSIAYLGLGEVFVIGFFGVFATAGTTLVLTGSWVSSAMVAGVAMGLLAVGILEANNIRDIATDAPVGKKTIAVRLGDERARVLYALVIAAAFVAGFLAAPLPYSLLLLMCVPFASVPVTRMLRGAAGRELIPVLQSNSLLEVAFGACLALAVVWANPNPVLGQGGG